LGGKSKMMKTTIHNIVSEVVNSPRIVYFSKPVFSVKRPKIKKKNAPDFASYLKKIYVLDASRRLYLNYRDKLPQLKSGKKASWFSKILLRRLPSDQYDTATRIDLLFSSFVDKLGPSEKKPVEKLVNKIKKIKVRNKNEVKKNWNAQLEAIDNVFLNSKAKPRLKEIIGDKHYRVLMLFIKSKKSNLDCAILLAKSKLLLGNGDPLDISILNIAKMSLKSLKKYDDILLSKLKKSGALLEEDIDFVIDETEPKKDAPKRLSKKADITPETHPEFFTRSKPYKILTKPIPKDAIDLVIQKPIKNDKGKWTFYAMFTNPKSGQTVYTYISEHYSENQKSKFDIVRDFEKKGYDSAVSKAKKLLKSKNEDEKRLALIVYLVHIGHFRIGNTKSEKDDVYGLHNLQVRHAKVSGNTIKFDYVGKKEVHENFSLKCDTGILTIFKSLIQGKSKNDFIFTDTKGKKIDPKTINKFLHDTLKAPKDITIHKFRHVASTRMFKKMIVDNTPEDWDSMSKAEQFDWYQEQLEILRSTMRHDTIKTTLNAYIDPLVVLKFNQKNGFENVSLTGKNPFLKKGKKKTTKPKVKKAKEKTSKKLKTLKKSVDKKSAKKIKDVIEKEPKKLIVKIKKKKGEDKSLKFTEKEIKDLDKDLDDMLKELEKSESSINHFLIPVAVAKIQTELNRTQIRAEKKPKWVKNDRIIVEIAHQFFIGNVTAVRQGKVHVLLDNGQKVNFPRKSKFLISKGVQKKRKSPIPIGILEKFTYRSKQQKRSLLPTLEKIEVKLGKEKSAKKRTILKKRKKEIQVKLSKREAKELAKKHRQEEKLRKIAEKEAERLKKEQKKKEKIEKQTAKKEAERLRAVRKLERKKEKEKKEKEKIRKADERKASKLKKEKEKKERQKKSKVRKEKQLKKSEKVAKRIVKELREETKRDKVRKQIVKAPKKTPKVKTPKKELEKSLIVKVKKKKSKPPIKKAKKGMAKILQSVRNTLGKQLTGIPKLFLDPSNLMFLTPGYAKKKDTVGVLFEVIDDDTDFVGKLNAYLDKDNFIEGYFNGIKDQWQIPEDQSFGLARVVVKRGGYVTDARFMEAVKALIDEAKIRSGYVDSEEEFLKGLKKVLRQFSPALTANKESLIVSLPMDDRVIIKNKPTEKLLDKIPLPIIEDMNMSQMKAFIRKYSLRIPKIIKIKEEKELRVALRSAITDHNAHRAYREKLVKIDVQKHKKGKTLLQVLKEDGWKESSPMMKVHRRLEERKTVHMYKGNARIILVEEGGMLKQTIITPLSISEALVLEEMFTNPPQKVIKKVIGFR
jgi:hypothetical protein